MYPIQATMLKARHMTQEKHHAYIIETADSNILDDTQVKEIMDIVMKERFTQNIDTYFVNKPIENIMNIMKELKACVRNHERFQLVFDSFVNLKSKDLIKQTDPEWLVRNNVGSDLLEPFNLDRFLEVVVDT